MKISTKLTTLHIVIETQRLSGNNLYRRLPDSKWIIILVLNHYPLLFDMQDLNGSSERFT